MKRQFIFAIALTSALALGSGLTIADEKASAPANAGATTASEGGQTAQWDQVDANKDGYISREEAKNAKVANDFTTIDINADGRLSKDEFAAMQAGDGPAGPAGPASGEKIKQ